MNDNPVTSLLAAHEPQYNRIEPKKTSPRSTFIFATCVCATLLLIVIISVILGITIPLVVKTPSQQIFDYIIVGAGAAGCVVAGRLSENPNNRVLLIEAGMPTQSSVGGKDYSTVTMRRDGNSYVSQPITRHDVPLVWTTIPWNNMLGYNWALPDATLGKGLGGGGAVNAMIYVRGIAKDFQDWNMPGWSYDDTLRLYKKSEQNIGKDTSRDSIHHSTTGPMQVTDSIYKDYPSQLFVESMVNAGHARNADFNGAQREGAGFYQFNIRDGMRDSTARSHLAPALNRSNLVVITSATVTRLFFEPTDRADVRGIEYTTGSGSTLKTHIAEAVKEVILSAGAIHTPKLLLLSGIGPAADLNKLGIPVQHDIAGIGKNLHDHPMTYVDWFYNDAYYPSAYGISKHMDAYAWARNGIFAWSGLTAGGFAKSRQTLDRPDVQFTVFPKDLESSLDIDVEAPVPPRRAAVTATVTLDTPKYRGSVTLKSKDPSDPPLLLDTLETQFKERRMPQEDLDSLVWGIKELRRIRQFAPFNTTIGEEFHPGASVVTDQQIRDWIIANIKRTDHWVGSCKMGDFEKDPMAVVNEKLLVRGIKNLRIADGSVMPQINHGNTHATIIMIGEAAAEIIAKANNKN